MDEPILYRRVKNLCAESSIYINDLEKSLGFSRGTIGKWKDGAVPLVSKVVDIAKFFDVSVDYLLGLTDVRSPTDKLLDDQDIVTIQRAKEHMDQEDQWRMMQILKIGFHKAFEAEDNQMQGS